MSPEGSAVRDCGHASGKRLPLYSYHWQSALLFHGDEKRQIDLLVALLVRFHIPPIA
jgi:hypothetical protein